MQFFLYNMTVCTTVADSQTDRSVSAVPSTIVHHSRHRMYLVNRSSAHHRTSIILTNVPQSGAMRCLWINMNAGKKIQSFQAIGRDSTALRQAPSKAAGPQVDMHWVSASQTESV